MPLEPVFYRAISLETSNLFRKRELRRSSGNSLRALITKLLQPFIFQAGGRDTEWELILEDRPEPPDWLLEVEETDAISQILCRNRAGAAFLPRGLIFRGGAQNRLLYDSKLLKPGSHKLPVFCAEMGRWDSENRFFKDLSFAPDFLRYRLPTLKQTEAESEQMAFWHLIADSLAARRLRSNSMNVLEGVDETDRALEKSHPRKKPGYGNYYCNRDLAFSSLNLYPELPAALRARQKQIAASWNESLIKNASGAREYFRLFDKEKRIAIRTDQSGKALRDFRRQPLLFSYSVEDLIESFTPPVEPPPPAEPLHLSGPSLEPSEFIEVLQECHLEEAQKQGPLKTLSFQHPEFALSGQLAMVEDRLLELTAGLYRPDWN